MLIIRFSRKGKKKDPLYRIIISEKAKDTQGKYLEVLGYYNPVSKETKLAEERIKYWLSKGAQLSSVVNNLLIKNGVIEGKKRRKGHLGKKKKNQPEIKETEKNVSPKKEEGKTENPSLPEEKKNEAKEKSASNRSPEERGEKTEEKKSPEK